QVSSMASEEQQVILGKYNTLKNECQAYVNKRACWWNGLSNKEANKFKEEHNIRTEEEARQIERQQKGGE
ncbi:hypothetical protein ScalyP_jg660, partial [Parmales sp. scaly parma]